MQLKTFATCDKMTIVHLGAITDDGGGTTKSMTGQTIDGTGSTPRVGSASPA